VAVDDNGDNGDNDDDAFLASIVPVGFATRCRASEPRPLSAFTFHQLKGRRVRLRVNGFDVEGRFDGADDDDVYLRGELRYCVYPMASVTGLVVLDSDDDDDDSDDDSGP
jgi:hypothetical protein